MTVEIPEEAVLFEIMESSVPDWNVSEAFRERHSLYDFDWNMFWDGGREGVIVAQCFEDDVAVGSHQTSSGSRMHPPEYETITGEFEAEVKIALGGGVLEGELRCHPQEPHEPVRDYDDRYDL